MINKDIMAQNRSANLQVMLVLTMNGRWVIRYRYQYLLQPLGRCSSSHNTGCIYFSVPGAATESRDRYNVNLQYVLKWTMHTFSLLTACLNERLHCLRALHQLVQPCLSSSFAM